MDERLLRIMHFNHGYQYELLLCLHPLGVTPVVAFSSPRIVSI